MAGGVGCAAACSTGRRRQRGSRPVRRPLVSSVTARSPPPPDVPWPPGPFAARFVPPRAVRGPSGTAARRRRLSATEPASGCRASLPPGGIGGPHQGQRPPRGLDPGQRRLGGGGGAWPRRGRPCPPWPRPRTRGRTSRRRGSFGGAAAVRFAGVAALHQPRVGGVVGPPAPPPSRVPGLLPPAVGDGPRSARIRRLPLPIAVPVRSARSVSVMTLRPVTPPTRRRRSTSP